jgi:hypothetical protein
MNSQVVEMVVLHGTVRDLLRVYPFAETELQDKLFDLIRGARNVDQEIRLQVDSEEQAREIGNLSRFAEAPRGTIRVTSHSRPGVTHTVVYKGGVPIACSCESFQYSGAEACRHMQETLLRGIKPKYESNNGA